MTRRPVGSDVVAATRQYEAWMARHTTPVVSDLAWKHEQMASAPFPFLRATFYRWAQRWPELCPELAAAPRILAVGDLHIENFGTWRDGEGRLIWGVNDFDEACELAYTNDLVRLATSARLAIDEGTIQLRPRRACAALLDGYRAALAGGGRPFVLEEDHRILRAEALGELRDPVRFWRGLDALPSTDSPPAEARALLDASLRGDGSIRLVARRAGLGSLGHPRVVAVADRCGGRVAREAKALVPPAVAWLTGAGAALRYATIVRRAVRCRDPFLSVHAGWVVRRLAPDCGRIELTTVRGRGRQEQLLHAMGYETGNVHLGSPRRAVKAVLDDLDRRADGWLPAAAKLMDRATRDDWTAWAASEAAPHTAAPVPPSRPSSRHRASATRRAVR